MWSLSQSNVHVALSAQRVVITQAPKRWPGSRANFERIACLPNAASTTDTSGVAMAVWQPAVQALGKWLTGQGATPTLHVVLSAKFVRWQLLDYRPELSRPSELAAYAALRFKDTFDNSTQDWQITHSAQPPGHVLPACAVDSALLQALHKLCTDSGARLRSVAPYFSVAFDHWSASLKDKTYWFGVLEPDCVSLALVDKGNLLGLRMQRFDSALRDVLPGLMAQMRVTSGVAATSLPLYLVGDGEGELPVLPAGTAAHWLRSSVQQVPQQDGVRMALGV